MPAMLALLLALQQPAQPPQFTGYTSPPSGDTVGYWQQDVRYRIVAQLDEEAATLRARAELVYVNHSPDTLREMFVHQYLNAFRPGSKWSAVDEREGRTRFQHLRDPDYGYERFTRAPTVDGVAVRVDYPGAPDSTVAHFALPHTLAPGDSLRVQFEWNARPSTVFRRQGREGRHWDFAQWYPKVAVYDRGGWEWNALVPAGELYGEYGTYDVTVLVRPDQVLGATGVAVEGDPGWARVSRSGPVVVAPNAYGELSPGAATAPVPDGYRRVRWLARGVHHFAWTASPDYVYEGGVYAGRVPVHVLYRPGDEPGWGWGLAVERTKTALGWLESIYGQYAYPQVTNVHRLDGGGTEFPMMVMNGSASLGLILHEVGHIYSYGLLGNNEWRSGWMDEGLTSYQTAWALRTTRPERARGEAPALPPRPAGYRGLAIRPNPLDLLDISDDELVMLGRAQPIGTAGQDFRDFGIYNAMVYDRAERMYGALRDVVGDTAFRGFLRTYYDRWKFKHVDERAMRAAAEAASGKELGWFFEQWVHRTGLLDYALRDVRTERSGTGWLTRARLVRRGDYRHPMPVGARTSSGWTIIRGDGQVDDQWVDIRTAERPADVRVDPLHLTVDWDGRNDVATHVPLLDRRAARFVFDWPLLDQADAARTVVALTPLAWYGTTGGVNVALRMRSNYRGLVSQREFGLALAEKRPRYTESFAGGSFSDDLAAPLSRVQGWATIENPTLPFSGRPVIGLGAGSWVLDGIIKGEMHRRWDDSPFLLLRGPTVYHTVALTATFPLESKWLDFRRWTDVTVADVSLEVGRRAPGSDGLALRAFGDAGYVGGQHVNDVGGHFMRRVELEARKAMSLTPSGGVRLVTRAFLGASANTPLQRSIGISALDLTETFSNHLLRPKGSPLSPRDPADIHYTALGGAALRGYSPLLRVGDGGVAALNVEVAQAIGGPWTAPGRLQFWASAFGDVGSAKYARLGRATTLADGGIGLAVRGMLFDQPVHLRADFPLYVRQPRLAVGAEPRESDRVRFRWTFSLDDLW